MTVKELKEKLEQFPDNCEVFIPDTNWTPDKSWFPYVHATSVARGVNEEDGYVFITDYVEDQND
jgi:hypothetical protein